MDKRRQWHAWYIVVAIFGVTLIAQLWSYAQSVTVIPHSQFLGDLSAGKIDEVRVSGDYIEGAWKEAQTNGVKNPMTTRVSPDLAADLAKNHVRFSGQVQNTWLSAILSWVLPTLVFLGLRQFWFRRVADDGPYRIDGNGTFCSSVNASSKPLR